MRLTNGIVWVEIPETHGPRIAGYGFSGESSVFGDGVGAECGMPAGRWRALGSYRMWLAPERFPETYRIDDLPPALVRHGDDAVSVTHADETQDIATSVTIRLSRSATEVEVAHVAVNRGPRARRLTPWGLSVVRPGGSFLLPRPSRRSHPEAPAPSDSLALWAYAALDDPRVRWTAEAIFIRADITSTPPWKVGASSEHGWCAYVTGDTAFVKRDASQPEGTYPLGYRRWPTIAEGHGPSSRAAAPFGHWTGKPEPGSYVADWTRPLDASWPVASA